MRGFSYGKQPVAVVWPLGSDAARSINLVFAQQLGFGLFPFASWISHSQIHIAATLTHSHCIKQQLALASRLYNYASCYIITEWPVDAIASLCSTVEVEREFKDAVLKARAERTSLGRVASRMLAVAATPLVLPSGR